jgi:hypothetical protein
MGEFSSVARFHKFVLEGNEKALEDFYKKDRQSPVLGDEEFRKGLIEKPIRIDREHPRYQRAAVRPSVDQVLNAPAKTVNVLFLFSKADRDKGQRTFHFHDPHD